MAPIPGVFDPNVYPDGGRVNVITVPGTMTPTGQSATFVENKAGDVLMGWYHPPGPAQSSPAAYTEPAQSFNAASSSAPAPKPEDVDGASVLVLVGAAALAGILAWVAGRRGR